MFGKVDKRLLNELQANGGSKAASSKTQGIMGDNFKSALESAIAGGRKIPSSSSASTSNYVSSDASVSASRGVMDAYLSLDKIDDTNLFSESGNIFPGAAFNMDISAVNSDRNGSLSQMASEGRLHGAFDRWDSSTVASTRLQNGYGSKQYASSDDAGNQSSTEAKLAKYEGYINESAANYGVDPALIKAVIVAESGGNANARSRSGARGLMQLMPKTAQGLGITNAYDPKQNIAGGSRYLRQLLDRYDGNVHQALAAYNWGMGNLDRRPHKMPQQTKNYIAKVEGYYRGYSEDASLV